MDSNNKTARLAGLLYLVCIVTGLFSLMYVPSQIKVHGDAAATASNIIASESLFRFGIAVGAIGYIAFLLLPLTLYRLLSPVNKECAVLMAGFAAIFVPVDFAAIANQLDILSLLDGRIYQQTFTPDQLHAKVMLLFDAYYNKVLVSEVFWGLWLLPFGYLVFKSGFLPKFIGILLMLGCFSYLITFFGEVLFPKRSISGVVMLPATLGEVGICLWLLLIGVREPKRGTG
jgi:hypothetical protein